MATTYSQMRGGSPYSFAGNLMARAASPITSLRATQALMGRPASVAAPLVAKVMDNLQEDDNDSSDKSDFTIPSQQLLPSISDDGKITYDEDSVKKAYQLADSATSGGGNGSLSSSNNDAAYNQLISDMHSVLNSNQPEQQYQQAAQKPFYKDSNFWQSALMMLVAAASGARPLQMMQLGLGMRQKGKARSFLNANMRALQGQYDPVSIEAALESGDMSKLKAKQISPEQEMQLKLLEQRYTGQMNAQNQQALARQRAEQAEQQGTTAFNRNLTMAALQGKLKGNPLVSSGAVNPDTFVGLEGSGATQYSPKGAYGKYQIMPAFWSDFKPKGAPAKVQDATEAQQREAVQNYLDRNSSASDAEKVAGYNMGMGGVQNLKSRYGADWVNHLPAETTAYLERFLSSAAGQGAGAQGMSGTARAQAIANTGIDPMTGKAVPPSQQASALKAVQAAQATPTSTNPYAGLDKAKSQTFRSMMQQGDKQTTLNKQRLQGLQDARMYKDEYDQAIARGDKQGASSAVNSMKYALARAEVGGTGMITNEQLNKAMPSVGILGDVKNWINEKYSGLLSDQMADTIDKTIQNGAETLEKNINSVYDKKESDMVKNGADPATARAIADTGRVNAMNRLSASPASPSGSAMSESEAKAAGAVGRSSKPDGTVLQKGGKKYIVRNGYVFPA